MCEQCAKRVMALLDEMQAGGEFDGLTPEERELERQTLGLRIRSSMVCPSEEVDKLRTTIAEQEREIERLKKVVDTWGPYDVDAIEKRHAVIVARAEQAEKERDGAREDYQNACNEVGEVVEFWIEEVNKIRAALKAKSEEVGRLREGLKDAASVLEDYERGLDLTGYEQGAISLGEAASRARTLLAETESEETK